MSNAYTAYLLARLPIGLSMLGHGLVRIPKLGTFSAGMVKQFAATPLPATWVELFSNVLPFFELITGALILAGLLIRFADIMGVAIMLSLIFGSCFLEKWNSVFTQMIYGVYFSLLYLYAGYNKYSVDNVIFGGKQ